MITNHPQWYTTVDGRIRSRLIPDRIDFEQYSEEEIKGILKNRVEFAFVSNTWEDSALSKILDLTASAGDIRVGLHLLREAGLTAEDQNSKKILPEHAQKALDKVHDFSIKPKDALADDSKAILDLVKSQSGKIGDIYKLYQDQGGAGTYKTFQRRIESLEKGGFIDTKKIVGGKEGTTTIISDKNKSLTDF